MRHFDPIEKMWTITSAYVLSNCSALFTTCLCLFLLLRVPVMSKCIICHVLNVLNVSWSSWRPLFIENYPLFIPIIRKYISYSSFKPWFEQNVFIMCTIFNVWGFKLLFHKKKNHSYGTSFCWNKGSSYVFA